MKHLLLSLFTLVSLASIAQDASLDYNYTDGSVSTFYVRSDNQVFKMTESGDLTDVMIFESDSIAKQFIRRPSYLIMPLNTMNAGGVNVHMNSIESIEYYKSFEQNSGEIKEINGFDVEYYASFEQNSGKLKKLGSTDIKYRASFEQNAGKIAKIGKKEIQFYASFEQNTGKLKKIGDINIRFNASFEQNSGKLSKVGSIEIAYFANFEENAGKFKSMNGQDNRVVLF